MGLEIKGFIESSFLDWDGKVVSTLFLPHCNFRCPFCHNAGLIEKPDEYETVPLERIETFLLRNKDFIDGVCLTGGEPAMHKDRGLFEFMRQIKDHGFQIKLDTNGTDPELLKRAGDEKLVDYIAMDIKGPLDERYDGLSGIKTDLKRIIQSIEVITKHGMPYEFRTTAVPTLLEVKDIEAIAEFISGARKFVLQQFVPEHCWNESLRSVKPYSREQLEEMVEAARPHVLNTLLRGI
jgi:pyruvate formate lyase activating enzyme